MKKVLFLTLLSVGVLVVNAFAATTPANWWRIITPATSGVQARVDALPKDKVEDLKIPILIGVAPGSFKKNYGITYTNGSVHQGQDIFAPRGAYVVSPTVAVVTRVDTAGAGGIAVYTANPGDETFYYAHMTAVAPGIHVGTALEPGDMIGYVGNTGDAEGASTHLHFQIFELNSGVIDPNPRLTSSFSDDERMAALSKIINNADDKEKAASAIVTLYKTYLSSIDHTKLPTEIDAALSTSAMVDQTAQSQASSTPSKATPTSTTTVNTSTTPTPTPTLAGSGVTIPENLKAGARDDNVKVLQHYLIDHKTGVYAQTLATYGATGYYGVLTKLAVIEFQRSVGVSASGYCGPLTRAYIASHS